MVCYMHICKKGMFTTEPVSLCGVVLTVGATALAETTVVLK